MRNRRDSRLAKEFNAKTPRRKDAKGESWQFGPISLRKSVQRENILDVSSTELEHGDTEITRSNTLELGNAEDAEKGSPPELCVLSALCVSIPPCHCARRFTIGCRMNPCGEGFWGGLPTFVMPTFTDLHGNALCGVGQLLSG